jgi:hypothetical protein
MNEIEFERRAVQNTAAPQHSACIGCRLTRRKCDKQLPWYSYRNEKDRSESNLLEAHDARHADSGADILASQIVAGNRAVLSEFSALGVWIILTTYSKPETAVKLLDRINRSSARDEVIAAILERRDLLPSLGIGVKSSSSSSVAQNYEHHAVATSRCGAECDDNESMVQDMHDSLYTPLQIVVDTARDLQSNKGTELDTSDGNVPINQDIDHHGPFGNVGRFQGDTSTYLADEGLLNYFGML